MKVFDHAKSDDESMMIRGMKTKFMALFSKQSYETAPFIK
jgi:hypothetical protein